MLGIDCIQGASCNLIKNANRFCTVVPGRQFLQAPLELSNNCVCVLFMSGHSANLLQGSRDVVDVRRSDDFDTIAARPYFVHNVDWRTTFPGKQDIRSNNCQQFLVQAKRIAYNGQFCCSIGIVGIGADADQHVSCTDCKNELREVRRE